MSLPRMSLHIGDYKKDTGHLRAAGHGAYLLLTMHYWATGGLPDDDRQLSAIAGMTDREWKQIKPTIKAFFRDGWRHKRIDEELAAAQEKYEKRVDAGKKSAAKKWGDAAGRETRSERLSQARKISTHTADEWAAMVDVFGGCVKCGVKNEDVHGGAVCKDHIAPIVHGGSDGLDNLQPLCRECNSKKAANDRTDYRDRANKTWRELLAKRLTNAEQPITLTDKELGGGGSARDPLVLDSAHEIAKSVGAIVGLPDPKAWPPGWCGSAMRVQSWLNSGWTADDIEVGVRKAMHGRDSPPDTINFFEKPIARVFATRTAPVPVEKPEKPHAPTRQRSALSSVLDQAIARAEEAERRDAEGCENPVRLLSHG